MARTAQPVAQTSLQSVRNDVQDILTTYFAEETNKAKTIDASYAHLWQVMSDLVLVGGKRLRPYLTILGYQAFDGQSYQDILQVAVAQELLHASLLIHDDIIDRDYTRYGRANVSGAMLEKYRGLTQSNTSAEHYAHSAAILAGDLLISGAYQFMLRGTFEEAKRSAALEIFNRGIFDVAGGEFLDTESVLEPHEHVNSLNIAKYKTASYSLVAPLCIGATLAGATSEHIVELRAYGQNIGIAYQLVDDMLGLFGSEETTGKPILSDLREGKRTYILQQTLQHASSEQQAIVLRSLGNQEATMQDLEDIRHIVKTSGAQKYVEDKIDTYTQTALSHLNNTAIAPAVKIALEQLTGLALKRKK